MTIEQILKLIDSYGVALVILAGTIYGLYKFLRPVSTELRARIFKIPRDVRPLIRDRLRDQVNTDASIIQVLSEAFFKYSTDWALIWQFHNSVFSLSGFPFLKISATHEFTRRASIASMYQNLPLSLFPDSSALLLRNKIFSIGDDTPDFISIKSAMIAVGQKETWFCPITDENGVPEGVLTLGYVECKTIEAPEELREYAARVAILIRDLTKKVQSTRSK